MKFKITRKVTKKECPWLDRDFKQGETVHRYDDDTYGCIGAGVACSLDGDNPFFEMPSDALCPIS